MTSGFQALVQNSAIVDLADRGRLRVTGEDRARLIHALTTNHIQEMKPGDRVYAFFLTAQGRIITDVYVICEEEHLLLDVPGVSLDTVFKHIDHYIIADDVTIEDVTHSTYSILAAGRRLYGPLTDKQRTIEESGLTEATPADFETYRIEQFHPVFGKDFNSSTLPQETGLLSALHFNKGCYLGQEIVERIRSRGHVNKMLVGLRTSDGTNLPVGATVHFQGEEVGQITSSANQSAIAMLRVIATRPGTIVQVNGFDAQVHAVS